MSPGQKIRQRTNYIRFLIFLFFSLGFLVMMFLLPRFFLPLLFSYVVAVIFAPILTVFDHVFKGKRLLSIIFLLIILAFFIIYPLFKLAPIIKREFVNLEIYVPYLEKFIVEKYDYLAGILDHAIGLKMDDQYILELLTFSKKSLQGIIFKTPNLVASTIEWIFLVPVFLFFILKDGRSFKYAFLRIVPNSLFERVYFIFSQFNKKISDYILAKFVEASLLFIMVTLGLIILDVRFSLLLGVVAGVTNIVPYLGPIIGTIPGIIVVLAEQSVSHSSGPIIGVILVYLLANFIDMALVFPILVSKIVNLHPVFVILSVIVGSQAFGVIGMVISIPIANICQLILQEVLREFYPENKLLDD